MSKKVTDQSWLQLTSIQAGGIICLPVIMVGQVLCEQYGLASSLLAIGIGNAVLLLLGLVAASMSCSRRQSTVEHAAIYFGKRGTIIFGLTMMLSLVGWFAIQLNMMSLSLEDILRSTYIAASPVSLNIFFGILLTALILYGIRGIGVFANLTMPLLILTLAYAIFSASKTSTPEHQSYTISYWGGVSLIIGVEIAAVVDLPTFFQHSKSTKDGLISITLLHILVVPIIEFVGVYLAHKSGGGTILEVFKSGHGFLWNLWVALFLIFAGITTNNANLYSAVVNTKDIFGKLSFKKRAILLGSVATLLSCTNPLMHIEFILNLFGIFIGSMGAVMLSGYILEKTSGLPSSKAFCSMFSWIIGSMIGSATLMEMLSITTVPPLDAFLPAFALNFLLAKVFTKNEARLAVYNR